MAERSFDAAVNGVDRRGNDPGRVWVRSEGADRTLVYAGEWRNVCDMELDCN